MIALDQARQQPETHGSILEETIERAAAILGSDADALTVRRIVIGLFFTGVQLSCGSAGACATPRDAIPGDVCCPVSAAAMPLPGKLAGLSALRLARDALAPQAMHRAVGIAALNALADACWQRRPHPDVALHAGADAFDAAAIGPHDRVVVVGAFVPFLKQLKRRGQQFLVLEQNPAMLKPEEMPFFRPAEQAAEVLPQADVVLITGSTLVNNTLEDLLALAPPEARVVVVGPTVGMLPDAFLTRGADVLGSIRVTQPDAFLDLLAEGGSPYHFLGRTAEKIVLARGSRSATLRLARC
jgi:uncharacterized protein (DUF4213/DUF364 family)